MKAIHAGILALVALGSTVPVTAGADAAAACTVPRLSATQLEGGYYVAPGRGEIWEEENGWPGLQIRSYSCNGNVIPADACLLVNPLTGLTQEVFCAMAIANSLL